MSTAAGTVNASARARRKLNPPRLSESWRRRLPLMPALVIMIVLTSMAFNTMMFLLMVRIEDPLVPRAMFGILNTLLFFPSGSVYPIQAFPRWLRAIAKLIPMGATKCLVISTPRRSMSFGYLQSTPATGSALLTAKVSRGFDKEAAE